jgi:hypothetical protein
LPRLYNARTKSSLADKRLTNDMNKKIWILIVCLGWALSAIAQEGTTKNLEISLQANKNYNEIGVAYAYRYFNFIDLGAQAELQFSATKDLGGTLPSDRSVNWSVDESSSRVTRLAINPFFRVNTPRLYVGQWSLSAFAEPMLKMFILNWDVVSVQFSQQTGSYKVWEDSYGSKFKPFLFDPAVAFGLEFRKHNSALTLAYHLCNEDIYSQTRTIQFKGVNLGNHLSRTSRPGWGISVGMRLYFEK